MPLAIERLKEAAREAERVTIEDCIPVELVLTSAGVRIRVGGSSLGHELEEVVSFAELENAEDNLVLSALAAALKTFAM